MQKIRHFIGGQKVDSASGLTLEIFDPATGLVAGSLAAGAAPDVDRAVQAAREAFPSWSRLPEDERSRWLLKIAGAIEARIDEFAEAEGRDQGKPFALAKNMDIRRAILNFRFFAQAITQFQNESTQPDPGFLNYVIRKPLGVAGLISPWNLPLYLLTWKIAPALAAGNTVVAKPSEFTSRTADLLADVCASVGLPAGVVNLVYGRGAEAGDALVKHPQVPLISFTGGTRTGQMILQNSAPFFKKVSLELGGKNPNLIFADCDLERAVATTVRSSFLNQGEICLCGSRIYVERSLRDAFLEKFVVEVRKLKVGPTDQAGVFMGPLVSREHLDKVQSYLQVARTEGGKFWCGGDRPALGGEFEKGYWLNPTVISDLPESSRCVQEEIFGPVVTVGTFESEAEALEKANGVPYGLSASVWTQNLGRAHRVARDLHVGTVWINNWLTRDLRMPFGGMKQSGIGREGGRHSLEFYTEATTVGLRFDEEGIR